MIPLCEWGEKCTKVLYSPDRSLIFPFNFLSSPVHFTGCFFWFFPDFFAIFIEQQHEGKNAQKMRRLSKIYRIIPLGFSTFRSHKLWMTYKQNYLTKSYRISIRCCASSIVFKLFHDIFHIDIEIRHIYIYINILHITYIYTYTHIYIYLYNLAGNLYSNTFRQMENGRRDILFYTLFYIHIILTRYLYLFHILSMIHHFQIYFFYLFEV